MKCPQCATRLSVNKTYSGTYQAVGAMECPKCEHRLSYLAVLNPYEPGSRATLRQFQLVPAAKGSLEVVFEPQHGRDPLEAEEAGSGLWRIRIDGVLARTETGWEVDGGGYQNRALALLHVAQIILGNPDRFS